MKRLPNVPATLALVVVVLLLLGPLPAPPRQALAGPAAKSTGEWESPDAWQIVTVDAAGSWPGETGGVSLALDSAGRPHVCYYDAASGDLKYAYYDGSVWQIAVADGGGDVGAYASLALDGSDRPHISYYDLTNTALKYAYYNGSSWQTATVDNSGSVGRWTAIVLDLAGRPHISYHDDTAESLRYTYYDGAAWQAATVDASTSNVGGYTSLALDSLGRPHISYFDWPGDDLRYAAYDGSAWHTEIVAGPDRVGSRTSLRLDSEDRPHIGYYNFTAGSLQYAWHDGAGWLIETVAAMGYPEGLALDLDAADRPHLSYYAAGNTLGYAYDDGSAWQVETVDDSGNVGRWSSLALDAAGRPHIAYYDDTNGTLQYAAPEGEATTPPARGCNTGWVYDTLRNRFILFGGVDDAGYLTDTWEFDGVQWLLIATSHTPSPARAAFSMVYDAARGRVVLFGGSTSPTTYLNDTWEYDGADWVQVTTANAPAPRAFAGMAYDQARGVSVLVGGTDEDGGGTVFDDTWEYNGTNWTQRNPAVSPPGGIYLRGLAYDAGRGRVVLHGGWEGSGCGGQTWEYDGTIWTPTSTVGPYRYGHPLAYDAGAGRVILYGGSDCSQGRNDTWEYDPATATWTEVYPTHHPPVNYTALAYDPVREQVVAFGGNDPGYSDELWAYDAAAHEWLPLSLIPPETPRVIAVVPGRNGLAVPATISATARFNMAMDPATVTAQTVVAYGSQTGRLAATVTYDGASYKATLDPAAPFMPGEAIWASVTGSVLSAGGLNLAPTVWQFTAAAGGSAADFLDHVAYAAGDTPSGVAAGDLDGDGDLDLVVSNSADNTVAVLQNQGAGTFAPAVSYPSGGLAPWSVALGDLNGDGALDFVVPTKNSHTVSVFMNTGAGSFAAPAVYAPGQEPKWAVLVDLDGDGDLDMAVVNWAGGNVAVFYNDGAGTFAAPALYATGSWPVSATANDLDNDGDLDLAVANEADDNVSLLLNDGSGVFTAGGTYAVESTPWSIGGGDLDGDGDADLATANYESGSVTVLLNRGDGTFDAASRYGVGGGPSVLVLGDLDGDGDMDLALPNIDTDNVSVLRNNGAGTFSPQALFDVGDRPGTVAVGDLDGDGTLDLAASNTWSDDVSILLNSAGAPPARPAPPQSLDAQAGLDNVLLSWEASPTPGVTDYNLYRRAAGEPAFTRLTPTPLQGYAYADTAVVSGMAYTYYATALKDALESDPSNEITATVGGLQLTIPAVYAAPGDTVPAPVKIENANGLCIAAMDIGILFDPTVAAVVAVTPTALTSGYAFVYNLARPGEVHISSISAACTDLYGAGSLFWVYFHVYPTATLSSTLDFVRGLTGTVIYDEDDLYHPVPLTLVDGMLNVGDGGFRLGDLNGDGVVNAADAALALRIAAGLLAPTPQQQAAGDVNGDGVINAADAAMILYYAAHGEWPLAQLPLHGTLAGQVQVVPQSVVGTIGAVVQVPLQASDGQAIAGGTLVVHYGGGLEYRGFTLDSEYLDAFQVRHDIQGRQLSISAAGDVSLPGGLQTLGTLEFMVNGGVGTWVEVSGGQLNDLAGRDFATSALQRSVLGGRGEVVVTAFRVYLPLTFRR